MAVLKIKKITRDTEAEQYEYLEKRVISVWKLVRHRLSPNPSDFYYNIIFEQRYKKHIYVVVHITPNELPPILEVQVPLEILGYRQIEKLIFKMNARREGRYLIYRRRSPFKYPTREFTKIFMEKICDRFPEVEIISSP